MAEKQTYQAGGCPRCGSPWKRTGLACGLCGKASAADKGGVKGMLVAQKRRSLAFAM